MNWLGASSLNSFDPNNKKLTIFCEVRDKIAEKTPFILEIASFIAIVDVLLCFSRTALENAIDDDLHQRLDELNVPKYFLDSQLYQRSCDTFLGVPFNIASYSLLTHMIAQTTNMIAGDFIWTGGDTHIYDNHHEQVNKQLARTPHALPTIKLNPDITDIDDFKFEDIELLNYTCDKGIKASVAI